MPLSWLRVVELGSSAAAGYCTRLLADFGAETIRIEPPGGDPRRREPPLIDTQDRGPESVHFGFLNFGKKSVVIDTAQADGRASLHDLLAGADVAVDARAPQQRAAEGFDLDALRRANPRLVHTDVSWFGRTGPYRDFSGTDSVVRALAGLVRLVGPAEGPPRLAPDYQAGIIGGLAAFIGVLAALHGRERDGAGRVLETSIHEALVCAAEYQIAEAWLGGQSQRRMGINRFPPTYPLGIYRARDGWVGITLVTPAQWRAFCALLGLDDWARRADYASGLGRIVDAEDIEARIAPILRERPAAEWFERGLALRLPIVVVPTMGEVAADGNFRTRGATVPITIGGRTFIGPGSPLHLTATPPRRGGRVPAAGADTGKIAPRLPSAAQPTDARPGPTQQAALPLAGLRIIDLSMGWAGPLAARHMADLGADVIKVEACKYPDWWRGVDWRAEIIAQNLHEKSARFCILNRNKRAITLDLTAPDGVALLKDLVREADALIENYSTGVLPKLGLGYDSLRTVNPALVMVSMSAFGASSPWRECRAYGSTLEQGSGLPHLVGRPDDPPVMGHPAYGDPMGGLNAAAALLVALLHKRRTGTGQHVDLSQVECMLPLTAPWMMASSASGGEPPRYGDAHPAFAPHGVFRCAGDDGWIVLAVTDDAMWRALARAIGRGDLADDPALASAGTRRERQAELADAIAAWSIRLDAEEAMARLQEAGVAAGAVKTPFSLLDDPHLAARRFWQTIDRAHLGPHPQPSLPTREGAAPYPVRRPASTLGESNAEVLGTLLGLGDADLERLSRLGVTGTQPVPA